MLNSWVNGVDDLNDHQAIDILGFPNPACSSDDDSDEGSNKLRSSLNLDLRYNTNNLLRYYIENMTISIFGSLP